MKRNERILAVVLAALLFALAGCGGNAAPTAQEAPESAARLAQTLSADATSVQSDEPPYVDVPADAWYTAAVRYVKERGLMNGTGNNKFSPDEPFTRAQLATVLYRIAGEPNVSGEDSFTDTEPGAWYAHAVLWAQQQGIVNGVGGGLFGTSNPVTQEQMATMLYRMEGEPEAAGASDASPYAANAVGWARENGIAPATADYTFAPKADATRAQIAVLLYGYLTGKEGETVSTENIVLTVAGKTLAVDWADNSTVDALRELLRRTDTITLDMSDYAGFEKGAPLPETLPQNNEPMNTDAGDIILYQGRQFVIYYDQNSYSLTPLGKITGMTKAELQALVGTGNVTATLSLSGGATAAATENKPTVYFTSDISAAGLVAVYEKLNWQPAGKVAVKVSTGEPPASNYLRAELIGDLVRLVDGTIVECNTAYGGSRSSSAMHRQVAADHGFTAIADFDLMDEDGEVEWPVAGGTRLDRIIVGSHAENYSDWLILSHYKGHQMAGYGGAIKNVGIGASSASGKVLVHTAGTKTSGSIFYSDQDAWLEALAEMVDGFVDHVGADHIVYVNVMNRLSVDCDCNGHPAEPDIHDIGILASTDPVALDQACYDLVARAEGNAALMRRIEQQHGLHTLEHAEEIGLGSRTYKLVNIDG